MQFQVFVKKIAENSYFASVIGLPDCVAEGRTEEEAINRVKALLQERLRRGRIVTIEVDDSGKVMTGNPWIDSFGIFKDDPTFDDLMEKIQEYRREANAETVDVELETEEATAA